MVIMYVDRHPCGPRFRRKPWSLIEFPKTLNNLRPKELQNIDLKITGFFFFRLPYGRNVFDLLVFKHKYLCTINCLFFK